MRLDPGFQRASITNGENLMDLESIIAVLRSERTEIDQAIACLERFARLELSGVTIPVESLAAIRGSKKQVRPSILK